MKGQSSSWCVVKRLYCQRYFNAVQTHHRYLRGGPQRCFTSSQVQRAHVVGGATPYEYYGQRKQDQRRRQQHQQNHHCSEMYRQKCTLLLEEPRDKVLQWLNSFDAVLTDCDGVLWIYSNVLDGAPEVLNALKAIGKKVFFCTNNSTRTRRELYEKGVQMGFNIQENEIISTAHSTAAYLKNRDFKKKVYIIGTEGVAKELDTVGIEHTAIGKDTMPETLAEYVSQHLKLDENIGAVIVGFDEHFSFPKLTKAASYLSDAECLFIATNTDERFPMPNFVIPGTGSIVAAVKTCAEREPLVIGKPNPSICEWLIRDKLIEPSRTLMIGDRSNTDILLGYNCGFQTLLVGTGIHQLSDVRAWQESNDPELKKLIPDTYLPRLGDLITFLK